MSVSIAKLGQKQFLLNPIDELERAYRGQEQTQGLARWRLIHYESTQAVLLYDIDLIDEVFSEREVRVKAEQWGDGAQLGVKGLSLLPWTQRHREATSAQEEMFKHAPSLFYERWLPWTESALKRIYSQSKEAAEEAEEAGPTNLYSALRSATLSVVARTVCSQFKGELLEKLEAALEDLDLQYARLALGVKHKRLGWLPSHEVKLTTQSIRVIDSEIRPLIRERIGGVSEGDDLISRWVNTRGQDGRSLKEDQILDETLAFLVMGYTSLPKLIFGAVTSINPELTPEFVHELNREMNGVVKIITNPPVCDEQTPPPVSPQNEAAWRTLPLHHAVTLEALRLFSPQWFSTYTLEGGVLALRGQLNEGESGPTTEENMQIWISSHLLHRNPSRFKQPNRFWPQRWAGNLEAQLPKYAFSPFGFKGKPSLSETFCREIAARFLLMWFARYTTMNVPTTIRWETSLCLRPATPVPWRHLRDVTRASEE